MAESKKLYKPLPEGEVIGPDENGIKFVIDYYHNEKGQTVRRTRTIKVTKVIRRIKRSVLERRGWAKFGDCAGQEKGVLEPGVTYQSPEEVKLILSLDNKFPSEQEPKPLSNFGLKRPGLKCRRCGQGGHWTTACPNVTAEEAAANDSANITKPVVPTGTYVPPTKREGFKSSREEKPSLRVTNLPLETTEDDLRDLFDSFGRIERVFLARDYDTGESRGFAFITFWDKEDGERALSAIDGHGYSSMILHVDWAKPREEK